MSNNKFGTFTTGDLQKTPTDADYTKPEPREYERQPKKTRKTRPKSGKEYITAKESRAGK